MSPGASKTRKRALPDTAQIAAWQREFWAAVPFEVLKRAAAAVRAGKPIDEDDRGLTATWLDALSRFLRLQLGRMGNVQLRAVIVDYLQEKKKMTLDAAAKVMAGPHRIDTVVQAVKRLRRGSWKRSRRK